MGLAALGPLVAADALALVEASSRAVASGGAREHRAWA